MKKWREARRLDYLVFTTLGHIINDTYQIFISVSMLYISKRSITFCPAKINLNLPVCLAFATVIMKFTAANKIGSSHSN